jgi:hypothetical protein
VAPIEKTLTGTIDFIKSAVTGSERQAFAGEGFEYSKGYVSKIADATKRFIDVMSGVRQSENLDTKFCHKRCCKTVENVS